MKLAVLDFETTGLDARTDHIIDAAVAILDTRTGRVLDRFDSLNEPPVPISEEITEITGLTDEMVRGHRLDVDFFLKLCDSADILVAHNARFDRGFFERHLQPDATARRWACTMTQVDWAAMRITCRQLRHIALDLGREIFPGHRAWADVATLVNILNASHKNGLRIADIITSAASASWALVYATSAPFDRKDVLRTAGWTWSPGRKVWWRTVRHEDLDALWAWLGANVYGGRPTHRVEFDVDPLRPDFEEAYGLNPAREVEVPR